MTDVKKHFLITLSVFTVSVLVIFGVFAYLLIKKIYPFSTEFLETERAIQEAEVNLKAYKEKVLPEIEASQENLRIIKNTFYVNDSKEKTLEFIFFIEKLIDAYGLKKASTLAPPTQIKGTSDVSMTFTVRGSYADVWRFMSALENERYLATITSFSITSAGADITIRIAGVPGTKP